MKMNVLPPGTRPPVSWWRARECAPGSDRTWQSSCQTSSCPPVSTERGECRRLYTSAGTSTVRVVLDTHLDGADVLLAEALERLDDLLVRAPQLEHNATRTLLLQPHITQLWRYTLWPVRCSGSYSFTESVRLAARSPWTIWKKNSL